ncbi:DNA repair protein RAD50-like isoform X2 [Vigna unguiculata]|uniref:DNA repair protein RAD50-like isoform X2 n=1 Tax=Vigna unguiculata TaxID=3917 RepID=UPI001017143E|nr:DNA repair protein RAD50-like isoform X2 [Vigna unguiculata]
MSTVDKMLIKGIRSFDPENKNVITFFKPLTLIVGPNGAGKTTIIECLKLSCSGELPPNARSGHSFIHDPKVAGETETKGQIKLRFKTAAGKDVVCVRSFQLTQKASKMEYKAIESVLQTINPHTGEKVCLSYRCADMDREIPALMGVSKAILENVIFVHQDEANWPLQDPSTLKKKFDDIFSATRYTKALEVIKKLHKEQAQEIKTYKLIRRVKSRLADLEKDLDEKKKANDNELEMAWDCYMDANDRWKDIEAKIKAMQGIKDGILKRIEEKKNELDSSEHQMTNVNLSHIDERERHLKKEIERKESQLSQRQFESIIPQMQNEIFSVDQKIRAVNSEKDIMTADSADRVMLSHKKAELENRKKKHKKMFDDLKDKIRKVLKGRVPLDKDVKKEITQALRAVGAEFDDMNAKYRDAEKEVNMLQIKIQEVNGNLSKHRKDLESNIILLMV